MGRGLHSVSRGDSSSGTDENPGMCPVAALLVTSLEKAKDRIIKEMVFV